MNLACGRELHFFGRVNARVLSSTRLRYLRLNYADKRTGKVWCSEKNIVLEKPIDGWKSLKSFEEEKIHFMEFLNRAALSSPKQEKNASRREAAKKAQSLKNIEAV